MQHIFAIISKKKKEEMGEKMVRSKEGKKEITKTMSPGV